MDDRELLELAAKAAGLALLLVPNAAQTSADWWAYYKSFKPDTAKPWNPLESDGDALRLAVKLDIEVYQADDDGPATWAGYWGKPQRRDVERLFCCEPHGDPYAATRRAIVRAAAEIGKEQSNES